MRIKVSFLLVLCMILVIGCGNQKALIHPSPPTAEEIAIIEEDPVVEEDFITEENTTETIEYSFPDVVELNFKPVELVELEEGKPLESWEFLGSIPLGEMEGKIVNLYVYQETDGDNMCGFTYNGFYYENIALLEYDGIMYQVNECLSSGFLANFPEKNPYAHILPHIFVSEDGQIILHATIELFSNTSGRMLYIFYDTLNNRWLTDWTWGYPFLADLDSSGDFELVIQFQGGGMHWPDATIYRWNDGELEASIGLKAALGIDMNWNTVMFDDTKQPVFHADFSLDPSSEYQTINATYRYEDGKLFKIE